MKQQGHRRPTLMYLAGTQDPHRALGYLRRQEDDPAALFVPYIRQFLELCDELAANAIVVSTRGPRAKTTTHRLVFYNAANPMRSAPGIIYDLGQIAYGLWTCFLILLHRPDVVIVNDGVIHYTTVPLIRMTGTRVILAFHNTLWRSFSAKRDRWKTVARICRGVFASSASAILSASRAITENLDEATSGRSRPIFEFLPTYPPCAFDAIPDPPRSIRRPFGC